MRLLRCVPAVGVVVSLIISQYCLAQTGDDYIGIIAACLRLSVCLSVSDVHSD